MEDKIFGDEMKHRSPSVQESRKVGGLAIGIDLGGTQIKAVAINAAGNILHQNYQPTNDGDDATWKKSVAAAVKELQQILKTDEITVGVSAPG